MATTLVVTASVSMLLVTGLNYVVTDRVLADDMVNELDMILDSRIHAIGSGLDLRREVVALLAADDVVVDALVGMGDAVSVLDQAAQEGSLLSEGRRAAVDAVFESIADDPARRARLEATGLPIPGPSDVDEVAAVLLDRYHVRAAPDPSDPAAELPEAAADALAAYDEVRDRVHPVLSERARSMGARDLMLVTFEHPRVVHTTAAGIDLGADPVSGVFADGELGEVLTVGLPRVTVGDGVFVDIRPYVGAEAEPLLLVAAAVLDGRELVGAVVAQFPIDPLEQLMTAGGRWADVGLGETGQTFAVGRDHLLRTGLRSHVEDPVAHLAALRAAGRVDEADRVAALGTTVFVQEDTSAHVRRALDGVRTTGRSTASDGTDVLVAAAPLGVSGLDWVVVAEVSRGEARAPSAEQLRLLLLLAAIGVPLVALVGVAFARWLARPVGPLLQAAERVAAGDLDVPLQDPSSDEFGHLARRLRADADAIAEQERLLDAERRAVDELYGAVLPRHVVAGVRAGGTDDGPTGDRATDDRDAVVVAVIVEGLPDAPDPWTFEQAVRLGVELEALAARHGLERAWSAADRHLFVTAPSVEAGAGAPPIAPTVAAFVEQVVRPARTDADAVAGGDATFGLHVGVAAGRVRTAVLGRGQLAYGVWGAPVARAMGLASVGTSGEAWVDVEVLDRLPGPIEDVVRDVMGESAEGVTIETRDDVVVVRGRST